MLSDILAPNTDDGIGTDNMTAILVYFHDNIKSSQWFDLSGDISVDTENLEEPELEWKSHLNEREANKTREYGRFTINLVGHLALKESKSNYISAKNLITDRNFIPYNKFTPLI